jgi:hypothetical protein
MKKFRWIDDVEEWLEPMGYDELWEAVHFHCLVMHTREECDAQIEAGLADREDVLFGLKVVVCHLLKKRMRLTRKPVTPWLKVVSSEE